MTQLGLWLCELWQGGEESWMRCKEWDAPVAGFGLAASYRQ